MRLGVARPLGALSGGVQIDVTALHKNSALHRPWTPYAWGSRMTFDGVLLQGPEQQDGTVAVYSHFYRNGIMEAVTTSVLETKDVSGKRVIPHVSYEVSVLEYLPRCFQSLQQLGVRPPVTVSLSLIGVRGLSMPISATSFDSGNEIREETLIIPSAIIESFSEPAPRILKPMFDRVWNACGLLESQNFDVNGNWAPRHDF